MGQSYRQGDVWIERVDELAADLKEVPRDRGRIVLAYGEVTGHAHAVLDKGATLYEAERLGGQALADRFLQVLSEGGVDLVHEEHATITLPAGNYRIQQQREYHPDAIRNVAD